MQSHGREIVSYFDFAPQESGENHQRLLDDLKRHRLAGLIYGGRPDTLGHVPALPASKVPAVALMDESGTPDIPAVGHDLLGFVDMALDHLRDCGAGRIAAVGGECLSSQTCDYLRSGILRRGMEHQPYWVQSVNVAPHGAQLDPSADVRRSGPPARRIDCPG